MNPLSLEGTAMVPSFRIRFVRALTCTRQIAVRHPEMLCEEALALPRRIDDPASAATLARDLLRHRREDITLALYLDERHRLCGTAMVAVGWVQQARLSARQILLGGHACRAASVVLVRYGRYRGLRATEQERRSFAALAAACSRHGLLVQDHVVVTGCGRFASTLSAG